LRGLLLLLFLFLSCGVKGDPKPPPEPQFSVKRVGPFVFVIGEDLLVPGFNRGKGFWYKKEPRPLCFTVKHAYGRSKTACVEGEPPLKPRITLKEEGDKLLLRGEEGVLYRVYPLSGELPLPFPLKEFKGKGYLEKKYKPYKVALSQVVKENLEAGPLYLEVPPKPLPVPPPPEEFGYLEEGDKLYLYWFHPEPEKLAGFNLYEDGKKLNSSPVRGFTYSLKKPSKKTLFEVRAVNAFGVESKGAILLYSPSEPQKP